jgi:plasmid stabilization system protein ParE
VTVRFLEAARDDLHDAIVYYEAQRRGLGAEFRDEIRSTLERIERFPEAWRPLSQDIRRCRTHRFPYGVIYQVRAEEIGGVLRCLNGRTSEPLPPGPDVIGQPGRQGR